MEPKDGDLSMIRDMRKVMLVKYQSRHTWAQKRIFSAMTTLDVRFKSHPCLKHEPVIDHMGEKLVKYEMQKVLEQKQAANQQESQNEMIPPTQGQDQASLRRGNLFDEGSGSRKNLSKSYSYMEEMLDEVIEEVPGPPTPTYDINNEFRAYQRATLKAEKKEKRMNMLMIL